ncbi:MAG: DUF5615 family PIN-like protein [Firmicutes bacterium]|nr:DUF5615 family PIN-like protein [Bacillota bacterium]
MRIYVDENIPAKTVRALRELGHEVFDHRGTPREGIADQSGGQAPSQERRSRGGLCCSEKQRLAGKLNFYARDFPRRPPQFQGDRA